MRTSAGLTVIAAGAILAFAVTTNTPLVNVHIVGWVLIIVGLVGIFMPRKGYSWLRRRLVLRSGGRGTVVSRVDDTGYPPAVVRYPGEAPSVTESVTGRAWRPPSWLVTRSVPRRRGVRAETAAGEPQLPVETETIEEFTEE